MKYITLFFLSIFCVISLIVSSFADCSFNEGGSIAGSLDSCLSDSDLVDAGGDMRIETGVKNQIVMWTTGLASFFGLLAVGAIVYGGLMMTLSVGQDEKIKKGKDIVKWSLLGFLGIVLTGALIRIVVELIFDVAG